MRPRHSPGARVRAPLRFAALEGRNGSLRKRVSEEGGIKGMGKGFTVDHGRRGSKEKEFDRGGRKLEELQHWSWKDLEFPWEFAWGQEVRVGSWMLRQGCSRGNRVAGV